MKYNNQTHALLEDNTIEPLYYKNGERRNFFIEKRKWYLMHDKFGNGIIVTLVSEIKKFLTKEEAQQILNERKQNK